MRAAWLDVRRALQVITSEPNCAFWRCTDSCICSATITTATTEPWHEWSGGCAGRAVCEKA